MTPLIFLGVCIAGGVGAALRFIVDGLVRGRFKAVFPFGTALINVTGSFVLGILTGLALAAVLPEQWQLVLGTGLIGGYTTFSTASVETMRLIQDGEYRLALLNGFGILILTVAVGFLGLFLGSLA